MIKTIIIVVIVMPLIQLVLGKLQEGTEKERYKGVIHMTAAYTQVIVWCMAIAAACAVVLLLRFGFEQVKGALWVFAAVIAIAELLRLCIKRYRITVGDEELEIVPFFGLRRKVSFSEIDSIKVNSVGDLKIIVRGRKVGLVDRAAVGYRQFRAMAEKKGLLEQEGK